jgi:hypothetical protein
MLDGRGFYDFIDTLVLNVDTLMRKDGFIQEMVVGVDPVGGDSLTFYSVDPHTPLNLKTPASMFPLPAPLRDHQSPMKVAFARNNIHAAVYQGEAWVFPDDDPQAALDYLAGGASPSEHPRRKEVVFVAGFWPMEGIARTEVLDIVRSAKTGSHLRPRILREPDAWLSMASSWLEDTLPQPDDPSSYRG